MSWIIEKLEELESIPRKDWSVEDWEAYNYIQQTRFENGFYDD